MRFSNHYFIEEENLGVVYTGQRSRAGAMEKPVFDLANIGGKEATDQEGPGFYFTTDKDEAMGYAHPNGVLVTATLDNPNLISDKTPLNKDHIDKMIEMAPDLDNKLANWGYDPGYSSKENAIHELKEYGIYSNDTVKDMFLQIFIELYRYDPKEFAENMSKIGYDGLIVEPEHGTKRKHIILYNSDVINVVEFEPYRGEE